MTNLREDVRNIAIIAHVDHGKTTLVDQLLKQSGIFRENEHVDERAMDSNDLERERGITILAKNTAIDYKGTRINILDTPGHADFGGEVERIMKMVDGVVLVVDAYEGTMPQTRFVLKKALEQNLKPVVVVNKIDKPAARPEGVVDEVLDLFIELEANDEQLDFPVVYASAVNGTASLDSEKQDENMQSLYETIIDYVPAPVDNSDEPLQFQIALLDYNDYVGRIGVGRVFRGKMRVGDNVSLIKLDGTVKNFRVTKIFGYFGLKREEIEEAQAGDLIAVSGMEDINVGETVTPHDHRDPLPVLRIDEPTLEMTFKVNNSPFAGREGDYVTARQIQERLDQQLETDVSLKVIADHARAVTALISDGVLPSNEGRGYVLRRILRRAVRHGRLLGIEGIFLTPLIDVVVDILGPGITSIAEKQDFVKRVVQNEEERFNQTLEQGLELLNSLIDTLAAEKATVVPGTEVFKLYDTYGFPWELTEEIASERGFTIDHEGFEAAMKEQRERAREARVKEDAKVATPDITFLKDEELVEDEAETASSVLMLGKGSERLQTAADGDEITVIVRTTPFHAEGGGQLGDTGFIVGPMGKVEVHNTKRLPEGTVYHIGTVVEGSISEGDDVTLEVDTNRRAAMARNHTATHLLHAALKKVLGEHVNQAGSLVTPDYLRFDFTHFSPVTQEELDQIEALVNEEILKATDLAIAEMSMDEAKAKGAMALFGDKYGDVVRVVEVPGFSVELCGGSHVGNTAFIGSFRLTSEAGIGSGVRRIEAITGRAALDAAKQDRLTIERMASELKTKSPQIEERLHQVLTEAKDTVKELEQIRKEVSAAGAADIIAGKVMVGDVEFVGAAVKASSIDELRDLADMGLDKLNGSGVVLVGAAMGDDKVNFVCKVSKDVVAKGAKAGNIVKAAAQVAGGNGGGRPDMAQAGGKEPAKLMEALKAGGEALKSMLQ